MNNTNLEKIDTSYWLTKDKAWLEERKAQWPAIERLVELNRKKTEVNVIKQYFLRGKMPNWEKYKNWDDLFRHLDLNLFLWLHPSSDPEVLTPLFKAYMESNLVHEGDVFLGVESFLSHEFMRAPSSNKPLEEYPFPFMGDKNIILFRILFKDIGYLKNGLRRFFDKEDEASEKVARVFEYMGYIHFGKIRRWLMQEKSSPLNIHCIYQYDEALDWCLTTLTPAKEEEFLNDIKPKQGLQSYQKVLYCIHHFDTEKEGDTPRTRFAHKIRKILDERDFIPEFKQIWEDVKANRIEVKDPWKR